MMNKIYNKENKKDRFIIDHLLTYLLQYIEKNENSEYVSDSIARMYIFPYKTSDGVKIGSLKEPNISWYYTDEKDKNIISSGSYRIIADDILKQEQVRKIRQIFTPCGLLNTYTNLAVVKDLILRMSKENDYTELWWTCAYDVFRLWDPKTDNINMSEATKSIRNNYFFFDEDYVDGIHKDKLIKFGIFRDILTDSAKHLFWDKIPEKEKAKAKEALKGFGVPCSFIYTVKKWNDTYMHRSSCINPYILHFAKTIGEEVGFPVEPFEAEYERCSLSHWLFLERIYKESKNAFEDSVYNEDKGYDEGVVVKNVNGNYVPLSWYLFYSKDDFDKQNSDDDECWGVIWDENEDRDSELEYLHIDANLYDWGFIDGSERIVEFSKVNDTADEYDIEEEDIEEFYQWVWKYSKHAELANNILSYYSGDAEERKTIKKSANDFVLSVIENYNAEDKGYAFDIDLQDTEAFLHADTVNKIGKLYKKIYAVVYNACNKLDVSKYIRRILDAAHTSYAQKSEIESNEIWEHVYLITSDINDFDGVFLKCKI